MNVYAHRGRHLLRAYHDRHQHIPHHELSTITQVLHNPVPSDGSPVCVIGTGAAGLYTAMIFESLGINYHLVDADTRERVGGRLFTYHFPNSGPYDYFDVGAMRFPDVPFMKRTFDLIKNRNLKVKLILHVLQMVAPSANTWLLYNNARVNNQVPSVTDDPFGVSDYITDPSLRTPEGVYKRVEEVLQQFRDLFRESPEGTLDMATAMDTLFERTNNFSMRSYMVQNGMSSNDISWCETISDSTGGYDRGFTETILDSLAFDWPNTPLPGPEQEKVYPSQGWYCFDGGSSTLPQAMFDSLSEQVQHDAEFRSPVTAISRDLHKEVMRISINGTLSPREYTAVISTVPLPRLNLMDLTGVSINDNYAQWSAIRELQYAPGAKVGMKFTSPWWETALPMTIHGGQSFTDLPIRVVVYPSYPQGAQPQNMSKVLIVSYTWAQDAERMGTLINGDGTARPEFIELIFRDLAAVHGVTVEWLKSFYTDGDYFAWDWLRDPLTMGASAFFGPGVYGRNDVYSEMLQPAAQGRLFFAGEATSTSHGWVAGALSSAWRAVDQYLALNLPHDVRQKFWDLWGPTEHWDEADDQEFVELNRKLMDRQLVIGLHKNGVRLG
ncbi:amine oxidase [Thelephora terrestris]|uniref:Amine oxidase n=1 Tax=Thelephora terrestris TaxID=56493 RepID=A0A9P6HCT0_9AGAM|nr:amine oxidase [Thelephora terrestris]